MRDELGRGAMGVVYRAHDPVIGRDVAVKTMRLSEAGTGMSREELVGRFQMEARAAGLLAHPNIVVIFDAGEEEGLFYITMELVEGRSLQSLMDARQLFPLPRVMRLMEQACSALDFAHRRNVIHRDIKPANLMLTAEDTLKITDFGTAKILQFGTAQTAHVMGTPSYMAPEQVKGKPIDGRSDIFSLGVILYELLTGEKPFPGQNITTVIYKIINEEPIPPRSLDSTIHPGLSAVVSRALAKEPAARYQSCQELLSALQNYQEIMRPSAAPRVAPIHGSPRAMVTSAALPTPNLAAQPLDPRSAQAAAFHEREARNLAVQQEASERKRTVAVLSVILVGIIIFTGYRIRPPLVDMWQRMHQSSPVTPSAPPRSSGDIHAAAPPEAQIATPKLDSPLPATPFASKDNSTVAVKHPAAQPAAPPAAVSKSRR